MTEAQAFAREVLLDLNRKARTANPQDQAFLLATAEYVDLLENHIREAYRLMNKGSSWAALDQLSIAMADMGEEP